MLAGASGAGGGDDTQRSLRFNAGDSAHLSRTVSSSSNRKTYTFSTWVKKVSSDSLVNMIFGSYTDGSNRLYLAHQGATDKILLYCRIGGADIVEITTDAVFRDYSAWMHLVLSIDSTASASADRVKIYINGTQQSLNTAVALGQNVDTYINAAAPHYIGFLSGASYLNGYLADIQFVDGQALDYTSFTEFDANGVLQPKAYSGTYGTNGFHLDFKDNSSSAALGNDAAGSNNWTPNNLSVDDGTGAVYTNNLVASGSLYSGTALSNPFDGNTSTVAMMTNSTQNQTLTFTPTGGIAYSSSVEVFLTPTGNVGVTRYSVNGGSDQSFASGDSYKTILSGSGTLTSFVLKQGAQSNGVGFSAIRIDGSTILINSNGTNNDSLVDTPYQIADQTDSGSGGTVVGNYCTLNPLANSGITLSNGNLDFTSDASNRDTCISTTAVSSGKWYWEVNVVSNGILIGIEPAGVYPAAGDRTGLQSNGYAWRLDDGHKFSNSGTSASYSSAGVNGSTIGVALDLDNGTLTYYVNNSSQGTAFTGISGTYLPSIGDGSNSVAATGSVNFGQRAFAYTAPSGYKSLNTANLPPPTIADGSKYFDTKLWTGNSVDNRVISGLNMDPDMVWIKARSQDGQDSPITDIVRGVNKPLMTNVGYAESNNDYGAVGNFGTNAFTIKHGPHATYGKYQVNLLNQTYVGYAWNGGTSTATNNDGTIASSVRASAASGFSIVTWTGNGQNNASVGHSLNAAPSIVIIKNRSSVTSYHTYVRALDSTGQYQLYLDGTQSSTNFGSPFFNADSTKINLVGGSSAGINASGNFVAWCFAPVDSYSAMGSYTGTGTSGIFVHTGMSPSWIILKDTTNSGANWVIFDSERDPHNLASTFLRANHSGNEIDNQTANASIDFLSNGFTVRASGTSNANTTINVPNSKVIWMAFAKNPFKTARAR